MVEGWEEWREAADSVFLYPVVCWLSVMRPHLRPRRPVIGQGIRWLPREAGLSRAASSDPKARKTSIEDNADTSPAPTCLLCGWLNRKKTEKTFLPPLSSLKLPHSYICKTAKKTVVRIHFCETIRSLSRSYNVFLKTFFRGANMGAFGSLCNPTSAPSWVIFPVIWLVLGVKAGCRDCRSASQLSVRGKKALSKQTSSHSNPPLPLAPTGSEWKTPTPCSIFLLKTTENVFIWSYKASFKRAGMCSCVLLQPPLNNGLDWRKLHHLWGAFWSFHSK